MKIVTKADWLDLGLEVLVKDGPQALSAEKLAKRLSVTRGSFYHHFGNVAEFVDELLLHWEEANTEAGFRSAREKSDDPVEQMHFLIHFAWSSSRELDVVIRAWAMSNDQVRAHVERVDRNRFQRLTELYQNVVGDNEKGAKFAKIAFYGLIGALHALPRMTDEELATLLHEVQDLMVTQLL